MEAGGRPQRRLTAGARRSILAA